MPVEATRGSHNQVPCFVESAGKVGSWNSHSGPAEMRSPAPLGVEKGQEGVPGNNEVEPPSSTGWGSGEPATTKDLDKIPFLTLSAPCQPLSIPGGDTPWTVTGQVSTPCPSNIEPQGEVAPGPGGAGQGRWGVGSWAAQPRG